MENVLDIGEHGAQIRHIRIKLHFLDVAIGSFIHPDHRTKCAEKDFYQVPFGI